MGGMHPRPNPGHRARFWRNRRPRHGRLAGARIPDGRLAGRQHLFLGRGLCRPAGFLAGGVEAVRLAGGLFIADEVQPGFARTGTGFWGFERHSVTPDIVTMGKPMGNGFPMAGMAAQADHLARFCRDVGYFNTFGGNPVAAAAGLAVLDVIDSEGLQDNATCAGGHLKSGLMAMTGAGLGDVRGAGLFIGVDICDADGLPDPARTTRIINDLRTEGVLIGAAGKYGATLKIRPPLCLSRAEVAHFLATFARVVEPG